MIVGNKLDLDEDRAVTGAFGVAMEMLLLWKCCLLSWLVLAASVFLLTQGS